jgi:hypothetical protein
MQPMPADRFDPKNPPELDVSEGVNLPTGAEAPTLASLRGKVVILIAFQMLCPGCVEHGLPQAKRIRQRFKDDEVAVIGLHSVFEHPEAMTPAALKAFMHEYRWPFPVAIDKVAPKGRGLPHTMTAYQMQGTPSLLIFDRSGRLRRHYFGRPDDMLISAEIMALAIEPAGAEREQAMAIEQAIANALTMPGHAHADEDDDHDHHHHHHEDACGCGHDHSHDHHHHDHDHDHHHGHDHHHHDHGHSHGKRR